MKATEDSAILLTQFSEDFKSFEIIGEIRTHNAAITNICLSPDNRKIYVTAEDGSIWTYTVSEGLYNQSRAKERSYFYSDEMLMKKKDVGSYSKVVNELKMKIEGLNLEHERQKENRDEQYEFKILDITNKYNFEINGLKEVLATLEAERKTTKLKKETEFKDLKTNNHGEMSELVGDYEHKFKTEIEKYQQLEEYYKASTEEQNSLHNELVKSTEVEMTSMKGHFDILLQQKKSYATEIKQSIRNQASKFETAVREIEEDAELEIIEFSTSYEKKIHDERLSMDSIIDENKTMKHQLDGLATILETFKSDLSKKVQEEKRLQNVIKGLQKDIDSVHREVQERNESIKDKDRRIADLKKKNQELEKFKFVLDYKISELRKQVEPRQKDVVVLAKHIEEMTKELVKYNNLHADLVGMAKDLKNRLDTKRHEKIYEKIRQKELKSIIKNIREDLQPLSQLLYDNNRLKVLKIVDYEDI